MEPFHAFLTIKCTHCGAPLLRLGLSANKDIAVCPVCLKAGSYDDVLEEGAELSDDYGVSDDTKALVRRLWASRAAT